MERTRFPVLTFHCPVCQKTFTMQPKRLQMSSPACPECNRPTINAGNQNPFDYDRNPFIFDCATIIMDGAMIDDISEKLHRKYPDKTKDKIKTDIIELSKKMESKYDFHRDFKDGYMKVTKRFHLSETTFNEDVICDICGSKFPVEISVKPRKN